MNFKGLTLYKLRLGTSLCVCILALACKQHSAKTDVAKHPTPTITDSGKVIVMHDESVTKRLFKAVPIRTGNLQAEFVAPARVIATVQPYSQGGGVGGPGHFVLFTDPELASTYSNFLEHNVNISTARLNLERVKDLYAHGASTGKDVLDAQTTLANEEAANIEHRARFLQAGLDADELVRAGAGTVWLICDIPEDQVNKLKLGATCRVEFKSFEDEVFKGKVESIGETVDNTTRMVKLRILMANRNSMLKAGMYATVLFDVQENADYLSVPTSAIITVQGKEFVFVQRGPQEFVRRAVTTGQQINDQVIIFAGLANNDRVVVEGAMQLKGLSFGY